MNQIKRLCVGLNHLFLGLLFLLPLINLCYWGWIDDAFINRIMLTSTPFEHVHLTPAARFLAFMVTSLPMIVIMYILHQLRIVFRNYASANVFCLQNAQCFKKTGLALLSLAVVNFFSDSILSVILSFNHPSGERILALGVGSGQFYPLFFGLALYIISFIMEEAHQLDEEQKYTV